MKYGTLKFASINIGDEIQSIAAQRFLPKIDYYIYREQISKFNSDEKVKLIMNSWYMWKPQNFPPNESIDPLLISMCFNPLCRNKILTKETVEFFNKYGPVGCRDLSTLNWFKRNNIEAYFSSCLTTTLIPNEMLRMKYPDKYVLCVDCSDKVIKYIKDNSSLPVYSFTKFFSPYIKSLDRLDLAKIILFLYQNAYCVITTNLHTALPCLAFGTKVCMLHKTDEKAHGVGRFEGMEKFFNWQTEEELLNGDFFNNPLPNPTEFEKYRDELVAKCKEFTGYDSLQPTLEDDFEPIHKLVAMLEYNDKNIKRTLYYSSRKDLLKTLFTRTINKLDRHDIDDENL